MKKIYMMMMLVLAGMMAMAQTSVWNGGRQMWIRGEGTEINPFLIESAENLAYMAYVVNKGYNTEGVYFKLTTDIDLNGSEDQPWIPIGLGDRWFSDDGCDRKPSMGWFYDDGFPCFRGHFDGGDHFIYNIYVDSEGYAAGLFGAALGKRENPTVIENVFVASGTVVGAISCCGGILGKGIADSLVVSRCWNGASINGNTVGGIVGEGTSHVVNCYNVGDVTGESIAGGIVGFDAGVIEECYNTGTIQCAVQAAGGILGRTISSTIHNCYNTGTVSAMGGEEGYFPAAGGLLGFSMRTSTVTNSYNVGEISCTNHSGCLIGSQMGSCTVENSYYLNTCAESEYGTSSSEEYMRTQEFVDSLNAGNRNPIWAMDENNINDGFPVLAGNNLAVAETLNAPFKVYPNPAQGQFTVEGSGIVIVRDLLGQTLLTREINSQITIQLPQGLYFLTLDDKTQKIVVK